MNALHVSFCFLSLSLNTLYATNPTLSKVEIQKHIYKAEQLIISSKSDSALLYLSPILDQLQEQSINDSPLGLKVRLFIGRALENDEQTLKAIRVLNETQLESERIEDWNTYVEACLTLAKLQESLHRKEATQQKLDEAKIGIQQNQLDTLYPNYYLRMASWHQKFGYPDSTKFYAKKAIDGAETFQFLHIQAESYATIAQLVDQIGYSKSIDYNNQSIMLWQKLSNYYQLAKQWQLMTTWYTRLEKMDKALIYNDSTIMASYLAIEAGRDKINTLHDAYLLRGSIYKKMGFLDTAYNFISRGYIQKIDYLQQKENERIVEIDERFKNQQKNQQIAAQARQINYERQRVLGLFLLAILILFLSIVLVYAYWRLRNANLRTQQQSQVINETNKKLALALEQQVILQGEIHHRVKNNLQVIVSLLELQKEELKEEASRASLEAMAGRIYSIAAIHEVLYQKEGENLINFLEYTQKICNHFSNLSIEKKPIFDLQIPPKAFNLETLMPLGIILNELLTNSLKYAGRPDQKLRIKIHLENARQGYQLFYQDNGPGFVTGQLKNRKGGLGAYLLHSMSRQLKGSLKSKNNQGASFQIYFQEKNKKLAY